MISTQDFNIMQGLIFTLTESLLSACVAFGIGVVLALLFERTHGWTKYSVLLIEPFFLLVFFFPPLGIIIGLFSVFGDMGRHLYGLWGIVLAHVILNAPLVFIFIRNALGEVSPNTRRLALIYDRTFSLVEWPVIKSTAPFVFGLVFLYAMLSFTIVLILGGVPRAATLELLIYRAVKFEYDLPQAMIYALIQSAFGILIYILMRKKSLTDWPDQITRVSTTLQTPSWPQPFILMGILLLVAIIALPAWIVPIRGFWTMGDLFSIIDPMEFRQALYASVGMTTLVALGTQFLALTLIRLRLASLAWWLGALSPIVLAVALIFLIRPLVNPFDYGIAFVIFLQAVAMLPLGVAYWQRTLARITPEEHALIALYLDHPHRRFFRFYGPRFWGHACESFAIIWALGFGDLALLPLFVPSGFKNLPVFVWDLIGSYKFSEAGALSLIVITISGLVLLLGISMRTLSRP